ncbi:uncharacterized protein E0L32_011758 [Thyridium curvatum]|uniref:Uncharacterized protein n=1 Tax=Thyridium curvatum TaxID=1093900 RepID=A0A507BEF8_9PEZI|nr:uncharacterized protein E0L32_011758 [Thyridium curvatum]TPX18347.1 hypothetical protein E0L32_011758 [Thyridium curvatum]
MVSSKKQLSEDSSRPDDLNMTMAWTGYGESSDPQEYVNSDDYPYYISLEADHYHQTSFGMAASDYSHICSRSDMTPRSFAVNPRASTLDLQEQLQQDHQYLEALHKSAATRRVHGGWAQHGHRANPCITEQNLATLGGQSSQSGRKSQLYHRPKTKLTTATHNPGASSKDQAAKLAKGGRRGDEKCGTKSSRCSG